MWDIYLTPYIPVAKSFKEEQPKKQNFVVPVFCEMWPKAVTQAQPKETGDSGKTARSLYGPKYTEMIQVSSQLLDVRSEFRVAGIQGKSALTGIGVNRVKNQPQGRNQDELKSALSETGKTWKDIFANCWQSALSLQTDPFCRTLRQVSRFGM